MITNAVLANRLFAVLLIVALVAGGGCDSFVEDVEEPPDNIASDALNDATQVPFLIKGVQTRFATTHDQLTLLADLLSDAAVFGENADATFPTYRQLELGEPELDNNSVDGLFSTLGQYRFLADQLIERIATIDERAPDDGGFSDEQASTRTEALYVANLHGGIARYFYAAYFGLNPEEGGGVIDRSPLIPSTEMYDQAQQKLDEALQYAEEGYDERLVHSLKARIHLFQGEYEAARTEAEQGLEEGDDPFQSLHSVQSANEWWSNGGAGRKQVVAADRFYEYVQENDEELSRIALVGVTEQADVVEVSNADAIEYMQNLYPEEGSSITLMSWQENTLMLAELDARAGDAASALERVNAVRGSHGLAPLGAVDLDVIALERDKEMFAEGIRLIDQRRLEVVPWHLPEGTWKYLPIPQQERNDNPCIPPLDEQACSAE